MFSFFSRFKNLLYIFQQEEYEILPFLKWLKKNKKWDDLEQKKQIVWTLKARLILIFSSAFFLILIFGAIIYSLNNLNSLGALFLILLLLTFFFTPYFYLILANLCLKPLDWIAKEVLILKAKNKLKKHPNLKNIGITGSYGKTSVKEFLNILLKTKYRVLMTPENINTPLGISSLIQKEKLNQYDVFIVEMGAYRKGDIKKSCNLVQPFYGILTGINESHLEKFGSLENTIQTKFELIESLPQDGIAFLNIDDANVKNNLNKFGKAKKQFYSNQNLQNIQTGEQGLHFKFQGLDFQVNLLGKHNLSNLMGAILVAQALGLNAAEIQKGVSQIKPISHRLEPILNPNGILVIDDSYNGNPAGVKAAIEVLSEFKDYRKIFITPGLVELGEQKAEIHRAIGKQLAMVCDLVVLIQNSNLPYFLEGLAQGGWQIENNNYKAETRLKVFETSQEAHTALPQILKRGDVILFQNDWTDNYT